MQASAAALNHHYYKDKAPVMLPPKRAFYQHHLNLMNGLGTAADPHQVTPAHLLAHPHVNSDPSPPTSLKQAPAAHHSIDKNINSSHSIYHHAHHHSRNTSGGQQPSSSTVTVNSSPYKRPHPSNSSNSNTQSPVAVHPTPAAGYPAFAAQQAAAAPPEGARYTMPVGTPGGGGGGTGGAGGFDPHSGMYVRPHLYQQAHGDPDYRDQRFRQMEIQAPPQRRRPSMLNDYNSHHAVALDRERENFEREQAQRLLQQQQQQQQQSHHHGNPAQQHPTSSHQQQQQAAALQQQQHQHDRAMHHPVTKKPRIMEVRADLAQPLRIDTRDSAAEKRFNPAVGAGEGNMASTYTPQVEAISPTLPSDDKADEVSSVKSSKAKDELLHNINKVDREIGKLEQTIAKLKKKQQQLEEQANKPPEEKSNTPEPEAKNQSIAQVIYAENRKKAAEAHAMLDKLAPKIDVNDNASEFNAINMFPIQPLYNQPSDTAVYHENKRRHMMFKRRLMQSFKKKHQSQRIREKYLTERYDQLLQQWVKKVERLENSTKRRAKDAKTREYFEKVFPELRKQREDKERFQRNRSMGTVRSEAEMEQVIDGITEIEEEEKKMRSYAVIPPMLLDARQRKLRFHNNNGLVEDPKNEHKEKQNVNIWTEQEKEIFRDKYLQHPKNFCFIASFLERKSVQDCVQYYYLSKKSGNYKQLVKKMNVKKRKIAKAQDVIRMREQEKIEAKKEDDSVPIVHPDEKKPGDLDVDGKALPQMVAMSTAAPTPPTSRSIMATSSATSSAMSLNSQQVSSLSVSTTSSSLTTVVRGGSCHASGVSGGQQCDSKQTADNIKGPNCVSSSEGQGGLVAPSSTTKTPPDLVPTVAAPDTTGGNRTPVKQATVDGGGTTTPFDGGGGGGGRSNEGESGGSQQVASQAVMGGASAVGGASTEGPAVSYTPQEGGVHSCAVCKLQVMNFSQSRPLTKVNCPSYAVDENSWTPDMRVCSNCRCKSVHRRYVQCPVPSCKNPKRRIKRLRPLPQKLQELPAESKQAIFKELQLTADIARCCSACFNRIARKMGTNPTTNEPLVPLVPDDVPVVMETPRWTEEEMAVAKQGLRQHGKQWALISQMVATKSEAQCKNFYFNYKKKFNLECLITEYKLKKNQDKRKDSVCESVASTISADHPSEDDLLSSEDEDNGEDNDLSDTDSSPCSPRPPSCPAPNNHHTTSAGGVPRGQGELHSGDSHHHHKQQQPVVSAAAEEEAAAAAGLLVIASGGGGGGGCPPTEVPRSGIGVKEAGGGIVVDRSIVNQVKMSTEAGYDSSATLSADEGPNQDDHLHSPHQPHHPHHHHGNRALQQQQVQQPHGLGQLPHHAHPHAGYGDGRPRSAGRDEGGINTPFSSYSSTIDSSVDRVTGPGSIPNSPKPGRLIPQAVTMDTTKTASPCVRDLIHSAIEKNLQMDKGPAPPGSGQKVNAKDAIRRDLSNRLTPSPGLQDGQRGLQSRLGGGAVSRDGQQRDVKVSSDLTRRSLVDDMMPSDYRGDPRAKDPQDPLFNKMTTPPSKGPPPAHSHHHHLSKKNEPLRPPSELSDRSRSPPGGARSQQPTPPSMWTPPGHFIVAGQQDRRGSVPDSTTRSPVTSSTQSARPPAIGQPPPLINISDSSPAPTGKAAPPPPSGPHHGLSPHGRFHPPVGHHHTVVAGSGGGSITQGIPAAAQQQQSPNPVSRTGGSISMGTPRFSSDPHGHQNQHPRPAPSRGGTPPHSRPSAEGGSITQGTPVAYDLHHGAPGRPPVGTSGRDRDHHQPPHSTVGGNKLEQMIRQVSPSYQPQPPPASSGYNMPEIQSRATLMGDFLTAQQMKDDRSRHLEPPDKQQHSPRSAPEQPPRQTAFSPAMIDPRQLGPAFGVGQVPFFLHSPYAAAAAAAAGQVPVSDPVRRLSPVPPPPQAVGRPVSPGEQERDRRMVLKNAVEIRDKMASHHHQQQQQQWPTSQSGKIPVQHAAGMRPVPSPHHLVTGSVSSGAATRPVHSHRGVIVEAPPREQQPGRGVSQQSPHHHHQQQLPSPHIPPPSSSAAAVVHHSASAPILDSNRHHQKDVHTHQSNEQIQFLRNRMDGRREGGGGASSYKRAEKEHEKQLRRYFEEVEKKQQQQGAGIMSGIPHPMMGQQPGGPPPHPGQGPPPPPTQHRGSRPRTPDLVSNTRDIGKTPTPAHPADRPGSDHGDRSRTPSHLPGNANNSSSNSTAATGGDKEEAGGGKRALTAASLIDIIITNQINATQGASSNSKYNGNILSKLEKSEASPMVTTVPSTGDRNVAQNGVKTSTSHQKPSSYPIGGSSHPSAAPPPLQPDGGVRSLPPGHHPGDHIHPHRQPYGGLPPAEQHKHSPYKPSQQQQSRFDEQVAMMTKTAAAVSRDGRLPSDEGAVTSAQSPGRHRGGEAAAVPKNQSVKDEKSEKRVTLGETIHSIIIQDYNDKHLPQNGEPPKSGPGVMERRSPYSHNAPPPSHSVSTPMYMSGHPSPGRLQSPSEYSRSHSDITHDRRDAGNRNHAEMVHDRRDGTARNHPEMAHDRRDGSGRNHPEMTHDRRDGGNRNHAEMAHDRRDGSVRSHPEIVLERRDNSVRNHPEMMHDRRDRNHADMAYDRRDRNHADITHDRRDSRMDPRDISNRTSPYHHHHPQYPEVRERDSSRDRDRDLRDPRDQVPPHRPRSGSGLHSMTGAHVEYPPPPPGPLHHQLVGIGIGQPPPGVTMAATGLGYASPQAPPPGPHQPHHQGGKRSPDESRPRSSSMGAATAEKPWRLKKALERQPELMQREAERQHRAKGPQQVPPAQPARSPVILPSDEREIIRVQRTENNMVEMQSGATRQSPHHHLTPAEMAVVGHGGGGERRSPLPMAESGSKPGSPRSPRGGSTSGSQQYHKQPQINIPVDTPGSGKPPHGGEMSPLDLINNKISSEVNGAGVDANSAENQRRNVEEMKENDSRFYPMATGNGGPKGGNNERPSNGNQTSAAQREYLRTRYYRNEEGGARKSPMPLLYPQGSRDSNSGGSPTGSRPASRSSMQGEATISKQPVQSPIAAEPRYSPRGYQRSNSGTRGGAESTSPYSLTPHPSPGGTNRMAVISSSPHAMLSDQQATAYSRSNSAASSSCSPRNLTPSKAEADETPSSPPRIVIEGGSYRSPKSHQQGASSVERMSPHRGVAGTPPGSTEGK